jgi:hypothetical protein
MDEKLIFMLEYIIILLWAILILFFVMWMISMASFSDIQRYWQEQMSPHVSSNSRILPHQSPSTGFGMDPHQLANRDLLLSSK